MQAWIHTIRLWLETSIHPAAPWALLTLVIFFAVYSTRKFLPQLWEWFDKVTPDHGIAHVIQGLPSMLAGVLLSVVLTGGSFAESWKGALAGSLAPVVHLILKWLPVPYQGAVKSIAAKAGIVALTLCMFGCAGSFEEAKVAGHGVKFGAAPPSPRCVGLDDGHRNWSAAAALSGGLAGVTGLAQIPTDESKELRYALAGGTVVAGAFALFATKEADGFASSWARECAQ